MLGLITPILGASEGGEESSNFLVAPDVGLMIWTLLAFGVAIFILAKYAFPPISAALDKRQKMIEESIDHAQQQREESDRLLAEYRDRLKEARSQADEILEKARKDAESTHRDAIESGKVTREDLIAQARKDIEGETRRAIQEIRNEVADLTIQATEKVTRKTLTDADQQRLVEEALSELDFASLSSGERNN
jgi:F-type H+-transporting ATPase subunit b